MVVSGLKVTLVPGALSCLAGTDQRSFGLAGRVLLRPRVAFAPDLEIQLFGEGIHAAHADAMQAAGDFVAVGIEFAAGVEFGHDDLSGGDAFLLVDADRNAAAVIFHGHRVIIADDHLDMGGIAGERFVDGIVDDLVDQMV